MSTGTTILVADDDRAVPVHHDARLRVLDDAVVEVTARQPVQVALLAVRGGIGMRVHEVRGEQLG